jgi:NitT/TauT family transport system ATP-binding protein
MTAPRAPDGAAVEFRHCTFGYAANGRPGPRVLEDFHCRVGPGEFACLLGPSGCGKTTLLHLLAGFLTPEAGRVLCGGRPVTGPGPDRGLVFQEPTLFPWLSARGNVEFGLRRAGLRGKALGEAAMDALALMGLADRAGLFPHALSGGMRQRVALARVLALRPPVLLLDEPFSALDAPTRERLQDELLALWAGRRCTILSVTHSVEEAVHLGQRILVLAPGGRGAPHEVPVDLPHPRPRLGPDSLALEAGLRDLLRRCLSQTP